MITQYLKAPPFAFISVIVEGQLILALLISCVITYRLVRRTRREAWRLATRERLAEAVVTEMMMSLEQGRDVLTLTKLPWARVAERNLLKEVLLEHVRSMSGPERAFLIRRYEQLGYVKRDLRALHSIFWWRRLRAASDLNSLESHRFGHEFHRLAQDRHELVSAFGYYALSSLRHEMNQPFPVRSFPAAVRRRRNLMAEILRNWARVHGPQVVTDQIPRVNEPALLEALVDAASVNPTIETSGAFGDLLTSSRVYAAGVVGSMLLVLRQVGDPRWVPVVRGFLSHQNEVVRLRALEYLVAVGEDDVLASKEVLADASAVVRRAVRRWRTEREAA